MEKDVEVLKEGGMVRFPGEVELARVVGVVGVCRGLAMSYPELASAVLILVVDAPRRRMWWKVQMW